MACRSRCGDSRRAPAGGLLRAQYLVGCDGGRSVVRKCAGIDYHAERHPIAARVLKLTMAQTACRIST